MTLNDIGRVTHFIYAILCICLTIVLLSSTSSATIAEPDPEEWDGSFSGGIELWYLSGQSYRKAGLNIENEHNNPYLVTGIQMTFNLSQAPGYKAKVLVQKGDLGEDQDAYVEHQIEGFRYGNEKKQSFLFTEDDHMIVDQDYNIQLRPLRSDKLVLQHYDDDMNRSRYWDPGTGDWDTAGNLSSPSLDGREWAMSALVEPVKPLLATQPQTDTFVPPDAVDAYFAELTLGKTYVFSLVHSKSSNFQLYIYSDRDQLGVPGKMTEGTLLANTSGAEGEKKVTWTAEYGGRHYILVKPTIGSGTYEVKYQENQEPVADVGDDVYANLELGGSVTIDFENTLSYDPDDDTNNNGKIDLTEDNNLLYYWDFDSNTDTDRDGNYTNDKDATGRKLTHTFTEGGKFTVTLTVEDPYGAYATDTLDLYLNYIPIVKMEVTYNDDYAYVEQKLTFNAEGSYDPDDDLNGNGIIDGTEVDRLTYSWDFYDAIDKNMDGNTTNDTDANNKMWLMKYLKAGTYTVTLNIWDNPEHGKGAHNRSQLVLEVMEKLPEIDLDIDNDVDYIRDNRNKEDITDDVLEMVKKGSRETTFSVGGYDVINLVRITAENEGNNWMLKLFTQGNIVEQSEKNVEIYYSYYIVRTPYKEQEITQDNIANVKVYYIYNFTFHNNELTVTDEDGEDVPVTGMQVYVEEDMLQINVSLQQLPIFLYEMNKLDEDEMDDFFSVFAMGTFISSKTVGGETQKIFARDSIGSGTSDGSLAGGVEDAFFPDPIVPPNGDKNGDKNGKDNSHTILLASSGIGLLIIGILIGVFGYSRIKRKKILDNETRHSIYTYINQFPGSHYSKIKKQLNISDNTLAHHINKLEEAELIKIRSRGNFKFYYPTWMKEGKLLTPMQKKIIDIIQRRPGTTSKYLAAALGKEPRTIRYHISNIADMGLVRAEIVDNSSHWFAVQGKMGKDELT